MRYYNTSLKNLEYRLRKFKNDLPRLLEDAIIEKQDVIVSAVANDQLYRRGVNGKDIKIMSYAPYTASTIRNKKKKGQPYTRVTLRDTGEFHRSFLLVTDSEGFYVTASDDKTQALIKKYGDNIFRLTDKNLNRILKSHIRKYITKQLKREINGKY